MTVVFLTTADPLYLPALFDRVLGVRGADTAAVYVVPPLYKGQTQLQALRRYLRTFGPAATLALARRVAWAKIRRRSIEQAGSRHGVRVATTPDVNSEEFLRELRALAPDVIISVSCPQIFSKPLIDLPRAGILNVHGALLPQYRGVMPSFWMLANGEKTAGVSVYFVNEQIDAGELLIQRPFDVAPGETLDGFLRRSKAIAAELVLEALDRVERGTAEGTPMDLSRGTYHSWPTAEAVQRFRASGHRLW
jgi:methionyl-tRNA formyltransferase